MARASSENRQPLVNQSFRSRKALSPATPSKATSNEASIFAIRRGVQNPNPNAELGDGDNIIVISSGSSKASASPEQSSDDDNIIVQKPKSLSTSATSEQSADQQESDGDSDDSDTVHVVTPASKHRLPPTERPSNLTERVTGRHNALPPRQSKQYAKQRKRDGISIQADRPYLAKLPQDCRTVQETTINRMRIAPYMTVKLDGIDFFHIKCILVSGEKYFLRGWHMLRTTSIANYFTESPNELVILADTPIDTRDDIAIDRCQVTIEMPQTTRQIPCLFTNAVPEPEPELESDGELDTKSLLTCRRIIIQKGRPDRRIAEFAIRSLNALDCQSLASDQHRDTIAHLVTNRSLMEAWRGPFSVDVNKTLLFSSKKRTASQISRFERRYRYTDICSGPGGSARGASMAGLEIIQLVDYDESAYETLKKNFKPGARIYKWDIRKYCLHKFQYDVMVDILHISFPCTIVSKARRSGQIDWKLLTLGKYLIHLLRKIRPRLVTMEQVDGILDRQWIKYFHQYLRHFTMAGYSVRYRLEELDAFGNPHKRRRLSIIASCPGEPLPTMPEPTHGPGLHPYVTIKDVLDKMDYSSLSPEMAYYRTETGPPYDPNRPLKACITGGNGGTDHIHPSGTRTFNHAEFAALQGFPLPLHRFRGTPSQIMTQIGNAVPAVYSEVVNAHLIRHLRRSDARLEAEQSTADDDDDEMDVDL